MKTHSFNIPDLSKDDSDISSMLNTGDHMEPIEKPIKKKVKIDFDFMIGNPEPLSEGMKLKEKGMFGKCNMTDLTKF